jgi:hypothetical protein
MIGQYLPNNNETATVAFRQKFCQLNNPYMSNYSQIVMGPTLPNGGVWMHGRKFSWCHIRC